MFGSSTRSSSSGLMPAVEGFAAFASMPNPFNQYGYILPQAQSTFGSSVSGSSAMIGGAMVNTTGASHNSAFGNSTNHALGTSGGLGFGYSSYAGFGQPTSAPSSRSSLVPAPASFSVDDFSLGSLPRTSTPSSRSSLVPPSFFLGNQSFPLEVQNRTPTHGSNSFAPQTFTNGCRGSRVAAYNPAYEHDSQAFPGRVVSIISMPAYSNRSHEELRWEDYQLGDKGTASFALPTFFSQAQRGGSFALPTFSSQAQRGGTRIAAYKLTVDPYESSFHWELVSLSSMTAYKEKSHEELRWEDYQLGDKGGLTQIWTNGAPPNPFQNNGTGLCSSTSEVYKPSLVSISSMPAFTKKSHELLRWEDYQLGDKGGPATKLHSAGVGQHLGMGSRVAAYTSTPEDTGTAYRSIERVETPLPVPCNVPVATQRSITKVKDVGRRRPTSTNEVDGQRRVRFSEELVSTTPFKQNSNDELGIMYYRSTDQDNSSGNFTFNFRESSNDEPYCSYTSAQNGALNISEARNVAIPDQETNVESTMPKLQRPEYYTQPRIEDLDLTKPVSNFVLGRHGYGSIRFLGEIGLKKVDLDSLIQFNEGEVIGLKDVTKKTQEVAEVSNTLAEVSLLNIKCIDKKTGKQYVDGPQVDKYREMLIKKATEQGAEFVSYDPVNGEWKFRVQFQI